jgi:hypothetical protein
VVSSRVFIGGYPPPSRDIMEAARQASDMDKESTYVRDLSENHQQLDNLDNGKHLVLRIVVKSYD